MEWCSVSCPRFSWVPHSRSQKSRIAETKSRCSSLSLKSTARQPNGAGLLSQSVVRGLDLASSTACSRLDVLKVTWDRVTRDDVLHAIEEYDHLGPDRFYSEHGFAPTTTYELVQDERHYPPQSNLGHRL